MEVDFLCQKLSESFINLGNQLLLKTFFDKFNFKNDLFLKSCQIFDEPSFINGI